MKLRIITPFSIFLSLATLVAAEVTASNYELKPISLPGPTGTVTLDYFAYDPATGKLWVPASNRGSVAVIDEKTDAVSQITGFKTGEIERRGQKRIVGPTSATIGDGVAYIGNRGDATLCWIDKSSLNRGECVPASSDHSVTPDGVLYVPATKEVWITARPVSSSNAEAAKTLQVFDASDPRHLKWKTKIQLDGLGEGYAVDNGRGLSYTNVEGPGSTIAIDVRTKTVISKWNPGSADIGGLRSEEHTSELQSQSNLVCRLLLEKKKNRTYTSPASRALSSSDSSFACSRAFPSRCSRRHCRREPPLRNLPVAGKNLSSAR